MAPHTLGNAALLFISTGTLVFLMGLQSLNVNQGRELLAAITSLAIGVGHLYLYQNTQNLTGIEIAGFLGGGPLGIVLSIRANRWWNARRRTAATKMTAVSTTRAT